MWTWLPPTWSQIRTELTVLLRLTPWVDQRRVFPYPGLVLIDSELHFKQFG
jgi:hypothetical protein